MLFSINQSIRHWILDQLVLEPSREPISFGAQTRCELEWNDAGEKLEYFVQRLGANSDAPADLFVLKFPGTAGRAERSTSFPAGNFPNSNIEVWTWNPPGYGKSCGKARWYRIEAAALKFWQHAMLSEAINDQTRIWIVGNSLGCVTALHVAATLTDTSSRTAQIGVLLRNPPPIADVVKHVAKSYPLGSLIHPVADSLADTMNAEYTAGLVQVPGVFLQSSRDELVLPAVQQKVVDAYAGEKQLVVLDGLTHAGLATEHHLPLIQSSLHWLWERTGS